MNDNTATLSQTASPQGGTVLVTGGAGYIGSHMVLLMKKTPWKPVIIDNFGRGNRDIAQRLGVPVEEGNTADSDFLDGVLARHKPVAVMHFAALAYVGESVTQPSLYYDNNVVGTLRLVQSMLKSGVKHFIFSSTCATYGIPSEMPISELCGQSPVNPYGRTKLMIEEVLKDFDAAYGLKSIFFRYFNAAGADPAGLIGERHEPESHLIPLALFAALDGKPLNVFGDDYPTPDGTCIRDYIHVLDIAKAHLLGLQHLLATNQSDFFNIGNGNGYSVLEVIKMVEEITDKKVPVAMGARRPGDPPQLVAKADKIREILGWSSEFQDLRTIVKTAYDWHLKDREYLAAKK